MIDYDDDDISSVGLNHTTFEPSALVGWNVRQPTRAAQRWSVLNGLAHGLAWAFPFVAVALVWRRAFGSDGDPLWPALLFTIGMLLLLFFLIKGILLPRTWWFAYTDRELIVEHGLLIKMRDHLTFDRVQYVERRAGPIMRSLGIVSLGFDTAAGRAVIPAAVLTDIEAIEQDVRIAMQRAAVV